MVDYWGRLKAMRITRQSKHASGRWLCRRGEEYPIWIEDPEGFSDDELEAMLDEYRLRYARFDC